MKEWTGIRSFKAIPKMKCITDDYNDQLKEVTLGLSQKAIEQLSNKYQIDAFAALKEKGLGLEKFAQWNWFNNQECFWALIDLVEKHKLDLKKTNSNYNWLKNSKSFWIVSP